MHFNARKYLASPSANFGQQTDKIAGNMVYGMVNSPYVFFMGETLGGLPQTPNEQFEALVDFAPGKILGLAKGATIALKGGYEDFAKQTKNQFKGTSQQIFEQRTKSFKANEAATGAIKTGENADKVRGTATETKKEIDKENK